ncbi:MAG: hypothetical protein RBT57_02945 [Paludibacter sp.]|jgi:hypothetical protein|nr:hypothetical protein [Paludibacter sp.]
MATLTFIEKQKNALIKKFHVLLGQANIDNDHKLDLLSAYGVESSKQLNVYELTELCGKLDKIVNPEVIELDKLRKRLIASIAGYRQSMGAPTNIEEIKAIACRAAEVKNFNRISEQRLRSLYNAFNKMRKDLQNVRELTEDKIKELQILN